MVLEVLVSALSMAAWAIGIYYHPKCASYMSGCFESSSDVLILEEANADVIANQQPVGNVEYASLCQLCDSAKAQIFDEREKVADEALPRAFMIQNDSFTPWNVCFQNDNIVPILMCSAVVSAPMLRRGQ